MKLTEKEVKDLIKGQLDNAVTLQKKEIERRPGAIPGSAKELNLEVDKEGNKIFAVSCMREDANDYIKVLKKNGFYSQQFDYDLNAHLEREQKRA